MRIRSARIKSAVVAACVAVAGGAAAVLPASPAMAASCPDNGWSILDGRIGQYFNTNYVNIRTGPSTSCTSIGQGQMSHLVQLDCWKVGDGGYTWTHLWDFTTARGGWVRDDLLVGAGAYVHC
jgi:hypothetical protein